MNYFRKALKKEDLLFLANTLLVALLFFSVLLFSSCHSSQKKTSGRGKLAVMAYPAPGTYPSNYHLEVTLSTSRDAYIYLTLDGSIPVPGRATTFGGKAPIYDIPIIQDTWLCYYAVDMEGNQTATNCVSYHIKPPPTSSVYPPPGAYNHPLKVTISTNIPAIIYYTTDGMDPVPGSEDTSEGDAPVEVNIPSTLLLKYFAEDNLGGREDIHSARYIIDTTPPHSEASPPGGDYTHSVSVTLRITNDVGTIYYTTDGEDPSDKSEDLYANGGSTRIGKVKVSDIKLNSSSVIKFFAIDGVGNREFPPDANPPYHAEYYVINDVPVLYANPKGRYYSETSITVELDAYPDDTKIYWALDEQPLEQRSYLYKHPIIISGLGDHDLYFFGVRNGVYTETKKEVYHLGYVRPPETYSEEFTSTDYIDVTDSTGVVINTSDPGTVRLDTYHATFLQNVNSSDVDLGFGYYRGYLLVAERFGGMVVYDVSVPSQVKKITTFGINPGNTNTGPYLDVEASENLQIAAVTYPLGALILDISDPTSPRQIANFSALSQIFYSPPVVKIEDSYLYAGGYKNNNPTLFIYDISTPSSPSLVSTMEGVTNAAVTDLEVNGNSLYLFTADGHIQLIDITDKQNPVKKGKILACTNCSGSDLAVYGDYVYAGYNSSQGGNLSIVSFSDPVSPAVVKKKVLPLDNRAVNGVSISGVMMTVSNGNNGVWFYDISDPLNPLKKDLVTPQMAHNNAFEPGENLIKNNALFVIDASTGFRTFEVPYNLGDYLTSGEILSFNVNPNQYALKGVKLDVSQTLNKGGVDYQVSPDGGTTWYDITPGNYVEFGVEGNDLRWEALLARGGPQSSPVLDRVTLTIYYAE